MQAGSWQLSQTFGRFGPNHAYGLRVTVIVGLSVRPTLVSVTVCVILAEGTNEVVAVTLGVRDIRDVRDGRNVRVLDAVRVAVGVLVAVRDGVCVSDGVFVNVIVGVVVAVALGTAVAVAVKVGVSGKINLITPPLAVLTRLRSTI